ncbi:uncharacterized protein [Aegilops tauschii subsp. strangulata]|uniref:uncharacterized protein n=1 Tax=Aegilops tauschii subsp. strangulata TaxID=200361 RepID=UPI00098ADDBE
MANSKSTAGEHQTDEDVTTVLTKGVIDDEYNPNTMPVSEHFDDIYATEPVLTSVENVEEYNACIIPVADNVDDTSTTELDGSKLLRVDDAHDYSLSALSNITLNFGTPVVQHGNGQEPLKFRMLESFENNKDNTTNLQDENEVYWHIRHDDNAEDIDVFLSDIMGDEPTGPNLMDEEYYMFRNQGSNNDSMDDESKATMTGGNPSEIDPFDFVYSNIPDNTHILKLAANCEHCKARKFESETNGFCCRNGQIELKQPEPVPELMRLWSSMDADSRHFRENIRFFNGHFAFTTLGVSLDENYTNMKSGVYTFRAHGTIYHNVHSFGPSSRPEHLQLYFYDDDPNLNHHKAATNQLDQDVVKMLVDILKENPYSQQFRSLGAHKDNLDNYRIDLNTDKRLDQRRYNRRLSTEVSAIWVEGSDLAKRGELGWHPKLPKRNVPWEVVQHPQLGHDDEEDAAMAVDMYIKIESCRLRWYRKNQTQIRADLYKGVVDAITSGETRASAVGTRIVLPGTYPGGDRDMKKRHMDAMAIVHTYGKPDIFLTMTCNPKWEEITNELLPGQTAQDRPDIVARVFYGKLEAMKYMLFKKHILGVVVAYVYVVEFQKRGLPHAHFLLIMDSTYKLVVPEQYDRLISAELPDKQKYPELHALVVKHMMHGPCGALNPKNVCMQDNECKCRYPHPFNENTSQGKDSYPVYRRRDDGSCAKVRGKMLDNRWVVPYNPYLLRMFNCHINVEVCSSIKAVKYLYKYIYKGHDKASFSIDQPDADGNIDEIKRYVDARWVTPPEAMWRIFGFPLCANYPPVLQLPLHLPNMHRVAFNAQADLKNVVASENASKSMLTEYFKANQEHPRARHILYKDFPGSFTWQKKKKFWKPRVERFQIGRIVSANPAEGERYYLRVLLNHVTGKTSFNDLLTVDGVLCGSFRDAAERLGLIEADNTLDDCLTEAEQWAMPCCLRRLFATILVHCEPGDVRGLWDRHLEPMSDDYRRTRTSPNEVEQMVLLDIRGMLQSMGKDIVDFALPSIDDAFDPTESEAREVIEESTVEFDVDDTKLASSLNLEQRAAYDEILAAVERGDGGVFFVDGPGGTGKTFLYRAMLAKVTSGGKIGIATATSGVTASIMPGGRTAHSRFKIPLSCDDGASCSFTKQSGTAKLLRMASLIIWDKASMTKRQAVEALDNSMRDIMGIRDRPFGGKTVVFGGDFTQVLPAVRRGSRGQIIDATLRSSHLWKGMRQLRLITNMRAHNDTWFADYLLRVGNGTEDVDDQGNILLPEDICLPSTGEVDDLEKLIDHVFPSLDDNMSDSNYMTSRAILSTTNDNVDKINIRMIERFHGDEVIYHSFDSAEDDPYGYYAQEFLNGLTPNGLPPHALKLKLNCPVILLRNIDPANGQCNDTRLVVRGFERNTIDAEIVIGQHAGRRVFLPRIPLCPSENDMFLFKFKRKQFPIRLSFAMTINKAQGQTIPIVGVYLPNPVFSHGQLYVPLSRATAKRNIKILIQKEKPKEKANKQKDNPKKRKRPTVSLLTSMKNIVYKEVLTG